jgi:hypothetical protein
MTAEFKRLGKRGAYRLGQLRAQGIREPPRPRPFRPRFIRPDRVLPVPVWLLLLALGVLLIVAGAEVGIWFMPFVVGLAIGVLNWIGGWPARIALPAVALTAALGWAIPLWWSVFRGQPYGAVARVIAAIGGLPGYAAVGMVVTVLIAAVQALAGYWLGRALTPLPSRD